MWPVARTKAGAWAQPLRIGRRAVQRFPTLDEVVTAVADLRPLGAVATKVLELADGDRFSAHELARVISSDQALSARMLRLSNSAY